ncbi:hypothetical protein TPHA_0G00300 [Tetrapisispora phaffii CBS 4417]|uniref:THIF-type NAD/FAD binding fold domain-containing protein n=1 Tax=Tetrapisispora phaffii (strain ATCC 24235 / CBS 4417 / NBRC 1672 / NRRL Y-8282 / UCD 70-5) TaxID=1071381 RepID=G8BVE0_TETPH|nr:hypothetical protein TPHA_0G00300 [Tetrapisispora phaffii CBS 4417]CCE63868.1 hypothetical protein TPHA_0G00300 [Tetrapisispora phaffii CBS 4417]
MNQDNKNSTLSADEIALYDRQIRLWGMAAQARMRHAKVLLINLGSIGTEITKNIVLSGIGSLTILDDHEVEENNLGTQFFLDSESVGKLRLDVTQARIKDLNPRVKLEFDTANFKNKDEKYFKQFDLVIGTELTTNEIFYINSITRNFNIPLYVCGSNGLFAYIFVDLIKFESVDEKLKGTRPTEVGKSSNNKEIVDVVMYTDEDDDKKIYEKIKTVHNYKMFRDVLATATLKGKLNRRQLKRISSAVPLTFAALNIAKDTCEISLSQLQETLEKATDQLGVPIENVNKDYIQQFSNQLGVEFAPVAAVIGGAVSQDLINILGKRTSPINNFIIFDGTTLDMPIFEF